MQELTKGKQEMVVLRLEHQRLSAKLQGYSIFNKYLEKVVENSEVSPRSLGGWPWHLPQPHLLFPRPWGPGVEFRLSWLGTVDPLGPMGSAGWAPCSEEMQPALGGSGEQLKEASGEAGRFSQGVGPRAVPLCVCVSHNCVSILCELHVYVYMCVHGCVCLQGGVCVYQHVASLYPCIPSFQCLLFTGE